MSGVAGLDYSRCSLAAGLVLLAGLGLWGALAPNDEPPLRKQPEQEQRRRAALLPTVALAESSPPLPPASSRAPARALNVVGPGPNDPHEPGMVPHPLDEARARIDSENRLLQALNDAMSFRKVDEMRKLLITYRELAPQDVDKSQRGYAVIADCIEFPGEASLAAAHSFYETERHSPLRRFVRRICFEGSS